MQKSAIFENFEPMINKLSYSFLWQLPKCSYFDLDDLKQECMIVLNDIIDEGKDFTACYVYNRLKWKLTNLWDECNMSKRKYEAVALEVENICSNSESAEDKAMLFDFFEQCMEISVEFVEMFIDGASNDLILEERRVRRARLRKRNGKRESAVNTPLKFSKCLIEDYFNIEVKKIREILFNSV